MSHDFVLEVRDLQTITVQGASLTLGAGERVAIIGESGSGKSVFLRGVMGLLKPQGGTVKVLGRAGGANAVAAGGVGVALQEPGLFDAFSVGDNLRFASAQPLSDAEVRRRLDKASLQRVDVGARPGHLSGGQQKRVSLLRALLRATRLLILDEPTSGLDPRNVSQMTTLLAEECDARGLALLMVTHDFELAARLCHRVLILSDGTLHEITPGNAAPEEQARLLREQLDMARSMPQAAPPPRPMVRWGVGTNLWHFMRRGLLLPCLAMALLGVGLVIQSASAGLFDLSAFVPKLSVASSFRELAPLVVGLLLASSIGAHISSEVAAMSYSGQLDAMKLLGISPRRKLLYPYAVAATLVFPTAILLGAVTAVGSGGLAAGYPWSGLTIGTTRFFVLAQDAMGPLLVGSCFVKGVLMGLAVALVAYLSSCRPVRTAAALGSTVTAAAVLSSIAVVLVDVIITWTFFV